MLLETIELAVIFANLYTAWVPKDKMEFNFVPERESTTVQLTLYAS